MQLINREDHQKLYLQLYEILKKKIESNEWQVGAQIPTEEDLCKMFNVSRVTVRTAVLELVRQGYLKRQQGKGTFIYRSSIAEGLTMFTNFRELMFEEGLKFTTTILTRAVMPTPDDLDKSLGISKDSNLMYIKRIHSLEDGPFLLQESFIPYQICPLLLEEPIDHHSLFDLFEKRCGIKITRVKNYFDITNIKEEEARLLGLPEHSSSLLLKQFFHSGETLVMYTRSIKKADRSMFLVELERKAT